MIKPTKHIITYLVVGGSNTLFSLLLFYAFLKIGIHYLVANVLCFLIGVVTGYILNTLIVFKHQLKFHALFKYSGIYLISMVFNLVLLFSFVHFGGLGKMFAQIATTAIITVFNYLLIRQIVFK